MPDKKREAAERWRQAGRVLARLDPVAFEAMLAAAEELLVAQAADSSDEISKTDFPC